MKSVSDNHNIYKLSQKYRTETQNAYETTITNIYLNEAEFTLLKSLKGKILEKKRYPYNAQNYSMSIDVFEGRHSGLILAEMELERKADVGWFCFAFVCTQRCNQRSVFYWGQFDCNGRGCV
jgi:CYTH domain-containing protein